MRSLLLFVIFVFLALTMTRRNVVVQYDPAETATARVDVAPPPPPKVRSAKYIKWPRSQMDDDKVIWRHTVDGPARKTRESAHADAVARAADELKNVLGLEQDIPRTEVEQMIADEHEKSIDLGAPNGTAQLISLDLSVTTGQAREMARRERTYRVGERLGWLSKMVAVLVAGLFAVAGYVRLDEWSKGYYTRTLKVTALAAFGAAVFFVWKAAH